jgi:hydroxymethylpyrimidine pyrophosphatase-like HAD family hydrolase
MRSTPAFALLLDVDGPIASPVTRTVRPGIIALLLDLGTAGVPVVFNTGRSDDFIARQVMEPMLAAGLPEGMTVHAICEKGATWFSFTAAGPGTLHVDHSLAVPAPYADDIRALVAAEYARHMFFDETKRAMVSVEQHVDVPNADYRAEQEHFDADALAAMSRHGLSAAWLDHHPASQDYGGQEDAADYRVDPTIISTDIESVRLGKDLGAARACELLARDGILPRAWFTVGDSRTDYAMADWLHDRGHQVSHVDVRPADGVPAKPYPILTAADLGLSADAIHDDAGEAFLAHWMDSLGA